MNLHVILLSSLVFSGDSSTPSSFNQHLQIHARSISFVFSAEVSRIVGSIGTNSNAIVSIEIGVVRREAISKLKASSVILCVDIWLLEDF